MKPHPVHPLHSSRRGGGMMEGVESNQDVGNTRRSALAIDRLTGNPLWMRKLEERYQKLHKKIAAIPTSNTSASRFNFLTRRFLNETLAKAHKRHHRPCNGPGDYGSGREGERQSNTAPNLISYKHSLQTEELLSQPPNQDGDSDSADLNDENQAPEGLSSRPVAVVDEERGSGLVTLSSSSCSPHRLHLSATALTSPHTPGARRLRRAALSVDNLSHRHSRAQRSPLLERDKEAVEGNHSDTACGDLAQPAHPHRPQASSLPVHRSEELGGADPTWRRLVSACGCAKHGQGVCHKLTHGRPCKQSTAVAAEEMAGWLNGDMGDTTCPALMPALSPLITPGHKYTSVLRPKHPSSQYSQATTKSCPAALSSSQLPSASRRRSGGGDPARQGDGRDRNGRQKMKVFAQMSMEARHAITETLKEMGTGGTGQAQVTEHNCRAEDGADNIDVPDSNSSLPSLDQPQPQPAAPSVPVSRGGKQQDGAATTQPNPREPSMTISQRTTVRQRSYHGARKMDTNSSVNATVRGGRSPRRNRKPPSTTYTSVRAARVRSKSGRSHADDCDVHSLENEEFGDMDFDLLSMASTGNVSSNRSSPELRQASMQRMHLPAITSRTEPNVPPMANGVQHVKYRIRGVGSYRVAREHTFEITAPDFDIRYRDVISCQKGDRDTPPPDIFEKSVGKVRDWLNKYFFAS